MRTLRRRRREVAIELVVLAAYVALSLAFCYPLPAHLTTDIAGRGVDTRIFQWNNWWVKQAVLHGRDLDYTTHLYYPSGVSLATHNVNWVSSFLAIPLDLLFGPLVAYNVTFLLTFFLSGYAAYALVRSLGARRGAAFVAGLIFAFAPYHVSGNLDGQMNLANVQWLPLCVLFVLRVVAQRRWQDAVWAGVFGALASLDCWFFALFLGLWGLVYLVYLLIAERGSLRARTIGLLVLAVCVALLLSAPFSVSLLRESRTGAVDAALAYFADKPSDLLSFFVPSADNPLLQGLGAPLRARFSHWRPAYLGYVPLGLAIYALVARPRRAAPWGASGLFFASLALGTTLEVAGTPFPQVPMPFRWMVRLLPALKVIRQSSRFNVMVALFLSVLVGIALADLCDRLSRARTVRVCRWAAGGMLGLVAVAVGVEYLALPCPLSTGRVSPFYHALALEGGTVALLELPIDDFHSRDYLYPQTIHDKPLVNGYVARTPDAAQAFIEHQPLTRKLQIQMQVEPDLHDLDAEIGLLAANGVRYVVVHAQRLLPQPAIDPDVLAYWRTLFGPDAAYADAEISVYALPPAPVYDVAPLPGTALGLAALDVRRAWLPSGELLDVRATWTALADVERGYACQVRLVGAQGMVASTEVEAIAPRYPTPLWPDGVVVSDRYAVPIPVDLPAGAYAFELRAYDAASGAGLGTLQREVRVEAVAAPYVPALGDMAVPVGATYGEEIQLLGYTPHWEGQRLLLDVYWLALRAIDVDYKVFLHMTDPADGRIAAQLDTMPRSWSYPTSRWGRREVFVDRMELDLSAVAPGRYALLAGVYEAGGDRLAVRGADGMLAPDGRAVLAEALEVGARD
ncbi:MAG: glycosyltransferase family 39 protein [Anaerolineae bacterium]|nr:glycosyltransferase family 39 protein [Anaerolineae bacterium]